jgi:protein SCO1/2
MPDSLRRLPNGTVAASIAVALLLAGCNRTESWRLVEMEGRLPPLAFHMTSANIGKPVSAPDFRGKITILEFGYTSCPDVCPTTLASLSRVMRDLGGKAHDVRVLFVTVDPDRDTLPQLKQYVGNFAPQVVGLRGTPNELATLARRYRVAYSVTPAANPADIEVMHTPTLFVFDRSGRIRLLSPKIDDISAIEHDLRQLVDEQQLADGTPAT